MYTNILRNPRKKNVANEIGFFISSGGNFSNKTKNKSSIMEFGNAYYEEFESEKDITKSYVFNVNKYYDNKLIISSKLFDLNDLYILLDKRFKQYILTCGETSEIILEKISPTPYSSFIIIKYKTINMNKILGYFAHCFILKKKLFYPIDIIDYENNKKSNNNNINDDEDYDLDNIIFYTTSFLNGIKSKIERDAIHNIYLMACSQIVIENNIFIGKLVLWKPMSLIWKGKLCDEKFPLIKNLKDSFYEYIKKNDICYDKKTFDGNMENILINQAMYISKTRKILDEIDDEIIENEDEYYEKNVALQIIKDFEWFFNEFDKGIRYNNITL